MRNLGTPQGVLTGEEEEGTLGHEQKPLKALSSRTIRIIARESLMKFAYTWRTQNPENKKAASKNGLSV